MARRRLSSLTVTRPELLDDGSDLRFRDLVGKLIAFSGEIARIRDAIASRIGISSPQFNMLATIARLADEAPNVSRLARELGVSVPFVVTETGHLLRAGLIEKRADSVDRRRVNLVLSDAGVDALNAVAPFQREVNDVLFEGLSRTDFTRLDAIMTRLVDCSHRTLAMLEPVAGRAQRR